MSPEKFLLIIPEVHSGWYVLEDVFSTIYRVIEAQIARLIVIDSVAALVPRIDLEVFLETYKAKARDGTLKETEFASAQRGAFASALQRALRIIVPPAHLRGVSVLYVNHCKHNPQMYGQDYPPGGTAKDHLLNASFYLKRKSRDLDTGEIECELRVHKCNLAPCSGRKTGEKGIPNLMLRTKGQVNQDGLEAD